ncbi:MAG: 30S ribosomal protein S4 [Candidatus Cloacimonas sp. 4484_209]|nr:MAG: 30S ribosomal protein S4 [Candidatus Cloacimonas sp. 4484_209]
MARYLGPVCKLCRREKQKLFLKGARCLSEKCALAPEKKFSPPGGYSRRFARKESAYNLQLREKQKAKRYYGILEKQFKRYFRIAERKKGVTGEILLSMIERRLDNVVYSAGFARSRAEARHLVRYSHILVNGKKVNIPSYLVKKGDIVTVKEKSRKIKSIMESIEERAKLGIPRWLSLDAKNFKCEVIDIPTKADVQIPIQEPLIVEFYSK